MQVLQQLCCHVVTFQSQVLAVKAGVHYIVYSILRLLQHGNWQLRCPRANVKDDAVEKQFQLACSSPGVRRTHLILHILDMQPYKRAFSHERDKFAMQSMRQTPDPHRTPTQAHFFRAKSCAHRERCITLYSNTEVALCADILTYSWNTKCLSFHIYLSM